MITTFDPVEEAAKAPRDKFYDAYLKMWKAEDIPAPLNELQSIQTWLNYLVNNGVEKTIETMRRRMILLANAAVKLNEEGPAAEADAGIYDNRPEMKS
jgi:hypothetical protein